MPETSSAARAAILDRIRRANPAVDAAARDAEYQVIERAYQQAAGMERAAIVKTFAERLEEYDTTVHEAASGTVGATLREILAACAPQSVVVASGFPEEWTPENSGWRTATEADTETLNRAEAAVTGCEVAIAHTGTIVVKDARRLTLLPDRLVCVVRMDQVVETVPEAFARLQPLADRALTFISGPSATADIEMTRIRGVHGPRFLDVVLI